MKLFLFLALQCEQGIYVHYAHIIIFIIVFTRATRPEE